ncbi:MAG TPA: DNA topoisomerase IB, partial [Kaistella sp.]|nr:DNA topoisomerase IB [Kaistella sp.]
MKDPVKSAKAVSLIYTTDQEQDGIYRRKSGKKFVYFNGDEKIRDKEEIERINKLAIPPAWENVWICALKNGHLQATGIDAKQRKQYRYHPLWNALRNHTKFYRMLQFGYALPKMRLQLEKDLAIKSLEKRKVLAVVVSLMERTNIRIGNNIYEKLYGSFGLTTLKDKHVDIKGQKLKFSFKGKKGVYHDIELKNAKLARAVQNCKDIPGKELFQYYDENGQRHAIESGMANEYIKEISGDDFTAKDFRTWSGTVNALIAFKEIGEAESDKEYKFK